jgi:hypothetical protein
MIHGWKKQHNEELQNVLLTKYNLNDQVKEDAGEEECVYDFCGNETPKCRWEIDIIYRDTFLRSRQLLLKWFLCVLLYYFSFIILWLDDSELQNCSIQMSL